MKKLLFIALTLFITTNLTAQKAKVTKGNQADIVDLFDLFDKFVPTRNYKVPPLED